MNTEIEIDVYRCFKLLLSKWWIITIVVIMSFTAAYIATYSTGNEKYYAETTVYSVSYGSYQEAIEGASVMRTYADIITSRKVSERASKLIGDENITGKKIQKMVDVSYDSDSTVVSIFCYSADPKQAMKVANAVANSFVVEVRNITGGESVQVLDVADSYKISNDIRNKQIKIRLLAVALSGFITVLYFCLREIFSSRAHTIADCSLNGELDIIGVIPTYERL